jgi:hypothetical protein
VPLALRSRVAAGYRFAAVTVSVKSVEGLFKLALVSLGQLSRLAYRTLGREDQSGSEVTPQITAISSTFAA